MDVTTQTHLKSLREALEYRLHELRTELHAAEQSRIEDPMIALQDVTDQKDVAAQRVAANVVDASERRELEEVAFVEAALHRLDEGTYGDCQDCGEPIGLQRLQVQPAAQRCAACQIAKEHALDQAAPRRRR
jgi:RNA polymerase-binding protein DksA